MISKQKIFDIQNEHDFEQTALEVFRFQSAQNEVYKTFVNHLNINPSKICSVNEIPFLPIRFFKNYKVVSDNRAAEKIFTSSGTSSMQQSRHFVTDLSFYRESLKHSFKNFYGDFSDYTIFALLPSYLEREGSSLIDMAEYWIKQSGRGGFYLYNHRDLYDDLIENEREGRKAILIGVSFALLDFVEDYQLNLKNTIVMETGGMKGRKKEITREELHAVLKKGFGLSEIHSEYGMTELLSQAYSKGNAGFKTPNWMKILIRDTEDPLCVLKNNRSGGINVIDLANLNSCSFIATDDLGRIHNDGSFEVLGRFDYSDVRGCNLLLTDL